MGQITTQSFLQYSFDGTTFTKIGTEFDAPNVLTENPPNDDNSGIIGEKLDSSVYSNADANGPDDYEVIGTYTDADGTLFIMFYEETQDDYFLETVSTVAQVAAGTTTEFPATINTATDPNWDDTSPFTICFAAGTRIATPSGEADVEKLHIGDEIITQDGYRCTVKWIGRQTLHKLFSSSRMQPVCIRAGALGDGLPHSDLTVTADHGMIIDDLVVNAGALVNGTTIDWVPMAELPDQVTYYHIETENHDVILANGAPAETFVDYVGRKGFDNYQEYLDLYGGVEPLIPEMPMLRVSSRRQLPAHLCERFGIGDFAEDVTADTLAFLENNRVA